MSVSVLVLVLMQGKLACGLVPSRNAIHSSSAVQLSPGSVLRPALLYVGSIPLLFNSTPSSLATVVDITVHAAPLQAMDVRLLHECGKSVDLDRADSGAMLSLRRAMTLAHTLCGVSLPHVGGVDDRSVTAASTHVFATPRCVSLLLESVAAVSRLSNFTPSARARRLHGSCDDGFRDAAASSSACPVCAAAASGAAVPDSGGLGCDGDGGRHAHDGAVGTAVRLLTSFVRVLLLSHSRGGAAAGPGTSAGAASDVAGGGTAVAVDRGGDIAHRQLDSSFGDDLSPVSSLQSPLTTSVYSPGSRLGADSSPVVDGAGAAAVPLRSAFRNRSPSVAGSGASAAAAFRDSSTVEDVCRVVAQCALPPLVVSGRSAALATAGDAAPAVRFVGEVVIGASGVPSGGGGSMHGQPRHHFCDRDGSEEDTFLTEVCGVVTVSTPTAPCECTLRRCAASPTSTLSLFVAGVPDVPVHGVAHQRRHQHGPRRHRDRRRRGAAGACCITAVAARCYTGRRRRLRRHLQHHSLLAARRVIGGCHGGTQRCWCSWHRYRWHRCRGRSQRRHRRTARAVTSRSWRRR